MGIFSLSNMPLEFASLCSTKGWVQLRMDRERCSHSVCPILCTFSVASVGCSSVWSDQCMGWYGWCGSKVTQATLHASFATVGSKDKSLFPLSLPCWGASNGTGSREAVARLRAPGKSSCRRCWLPSYCCIGLCSGREVLLSEEASKHNRAAGDICSVFWALYKGSAARVDAVAWWKWWFLCKSLGSQGDAGFWACVGEWEMQRLCFLNLDTFSLSDCSSSMS